MGCFRRKPDTRFRTGVCFVGGKKILSLIMGEWQKPVNGGVVNVKSK